jgi:ComF family protein
MKYEGYFALARPLGELMVAAWPRWEHQLDLVVPIPLHSLRKRERGYNQSELLTDVLQQELDLPSLPEALNRSRHTRPQLGLTANERRANVRDAFTANRVLVQGKRIMLVDDVFTTGSTLTAAAEALHQAGACSVTAYCLTTAAQVPKDEVDLS